MKLDSKLKREIKEFLRKKMEEERKTIYIFSPYKLSEEEIKKIKEKIPGIENGRIVNEVDESLIAGFKIRIGTRVFDFSLKSRLNSLKQKIYENA